MAVDFTKVPSRHKGRDGVWTGGDYLGLEPQGNCEGG
jgi:hypothetical protein